MPIETIIALAAKTANVSTGLLLAVCMQETGLKNVTVQNDGGSPSIGICQVKMGTAKMMKFGGSEKDLSDNFMNAYIAAKYLKYQKQRYGNNWCKAVAAYNAGSYLESQIKPGYPRNLKYVRGVQNKIAKHLQTKLDCNYNEIATAD